MSKKDKKKETLYIVETSTKEDSKMSLKKDDKKSIKKEEVKKEKTEMTSVPDKETEVKEEAMATPPETSNKTKMDPKSKKRHRMLFSPALFKESFKSNRLSLAVVSAGNALIMVIIIAILSTLHINATADAMKDLFSNADQESTVKVGAVSMYSAFDNTALAYETYKSSQEKLIEVVKQSVNLPNDSRVTFLTDSIDKAYKAVQEAQKKTGTTTNIPDEMIKAQVSKTTKDFINSQSDETVSPQEKSLLCFLTDRYLDEYMKDKSKSSNDILKIAVPQAFADEVAKEQGFDVNKDNEKTLSTSEITARKQKWDKVHAIFASAQTEAAKEGASLDQIATRSSFELIKLVAEGENKDFALDATLALENTFDDDPESYIKESSVSAGVLSEQCRNYVMNTMESFAYYRYLPSFTVEYKTSDRGYPIVYVGTGELGANGEEILKPVEVTLYNPDKYELVKGDMGTSANMLQKMHKDVLTGEGYSDEEIKKAKEEAKDDLKFISSSLDSFMNDYHYRENGKNEYYDNGIVESAIEKRAVNLVSQAAEQTIIDSYNESHLVGKVKTLEEINTRNYSMDGKELMSLVQGYASGGISSYKTYYANARNSEEHYSTMDCMLIANVKAGQGVIDQLPAGVSSALEEMGQMNTYGIMVGVVAFGIAALLVPMVYTILTANSLVAEKVESGSLAFTLSTPTPRSCYVITEGIYLLFTELVMGVSLFLGALITREIGIACGSTDLITSLPVKDIALYAIGNFMVTVAVSGICFFSSCWFNKTPQAIGFGGGLTIFFFICSILGLFGTPAIPATIRITAMNFFNYITIDSCFDAMAVMNADYGTYVWKLMILLGIAVTTYTLGNLKFIKKDLPL